MIAVAPLSPFVIPSIPSSGTSLAMSIPPVAMTPSTGLLPKLSGPLLSVHGGTIVESMASFDLTRSRVRLEGLSAYGVTTALLMNAALRILSATPKKIKDVPKKEGEDESGGGGRRAAVRLENAATVAFAVASAVCVLCSAYTTVVFSVVGLYAKTALGMGIDEQFVLFFDATEPFRKAGFDSFVVSLLCFNMTIVLNLFLTYTGPVRWLVTAVSTLISTASWSQISQIMALATSILFS